MSFAGTGVANPFPITFDANAPFSPNGPFVSFPSDLDTTRVHTWNVSVQRQLGDNTAVSASYIGNYTTNLWDVVTGNPGIIPAGASPTGPCTLNTPTGPQAFPNCSAAPLDTRREITQLNPAVGRFIGFLDYFTDTGTQKYNGLLLQVQRRAANGMSVGANYTLSKCEGHPSGGGGTANVASGYMTPVSIINPPDEAEAERRLDLRLWAVQPGPAPHLRAERHRPVAGVRQHRAAHGGVGLAALGFLPRPVGRTLTVTTGLDRALTGNPGQQRANQVLDDPYGDKTLNSWLNPAGVRAAGARGLRHVGAERVRRHGQPRRRPVAGASVPGLDRIGSKRASKRSTRSTGGGRRLRAVRERTTRR